MNSTALEPATAPPQQHSELSPVKVEDDWGQFVDQHIKQQPKATAPAEQETLREDLGPRQQKFAARLMELLSGDVEWSSNDGCTQKMMRELDKDERNRYKKWAHKNSWHIGKTGETLNCPN